ncbi:MAG TPA: SCO family protein [Casimicrobiaceae bacterium]|nr:SCO family protein [Casimicrobiaceae bacterium]
MTIARFVVVAVALTATSAQATALPPVDQVGFAPAAGAVLPMNARFNDEHGRSVRLSDVVRDRAAIVVPAYYGCSNLCTIVLRGVAASLRASGIRAGRDANVVAVSIAPLETPALALAKKREVLGSAMADAGDGWHFLTGNDAAIGRVTRALGYRYTYVAAEKQYAHASGIAIVAPDGHIARVLYGVAFPPAELRDALAAARDATARNTGSVPDVPASQGAVSKWLLCFHYDPKTGRYSFAAMNAVRAAGLLALAALVGYAATAWRRERQMPRRRRTR